MTSRGWGLSSSGNGHALLLLVLFLTFLRISAAVGTWLIADDNTIVREAVKDVLAATLEIRDCQEASNGREALECAEQTKPDLIILDVAMPALDGITAALTF